jgi:uncharacterized membrane protein
MITLHDAVIVTWPEGKKKPKTEQVESATSKGVLSGAFWGHAVWSALLCSSTWRGCWCRNGWNRRSQSDMGINDELIRSVRSKVTEGTSALFLMTGDVVKDKVAEAMRGLDFEIIASNLSDEQEEKLREIFAEEETAPAQ